MPKSAVSSTKKTVKRPLIITLICLGGFAVYGILLILSLFTFTPLIIVYSLIALYFLYGLWKMKRDQFITYMIFFVLNIVSRVFGFFEVSTISLITGAIISLVGLTQWSKLK